MDYHEILKFAAMGMAAHIPGYQRAIDDLQAKLDDMRHTMGLIQRGRIPIPSGAPPEALGVPAVSEARALPQPKKGGWPADPEERKAEMVRRRGKWKTADTDAQKARWANATKTQRAAWTRALQEGRVRSRKAQQIPVVKLGSIA